MSRTLKVALPNKGQLFEPTCKLLKESGYKAVKSNRALVCHDIQNNIEFYFLRPSDIPMYVSEGIIDMGITGLDFVAERRSTAVNVLDLHFGHSRLCAAVPNDSPIQSIDDIKDLRIATSFGNIVRDYFKNPDTKIVPLEGAVEISVNLGISDCIVDVVETGTTLRQAGLRIIGEPMFHSNAALLAHPGLENEPILQKMINRIKGRIVALQYVMIEYDVDAATLDAACKLTPGIASPTVASLKTADWFSVKSMILRPRMHEIMDELSALGCKGIVVTTLESARV